MDVPLHKALNGGSESVLVVEDKQLVKDTIVTILKKLGYDVISAVDGHEALGQLQCSGFTPDLLLTDIMLPGSLNGREVSEEVLALHRGCRIIYMSGYSADTLSDRNLLPRGSERLSKPFSSSILANTIRKALEAGA